jgi:hypothetical protein
MQRLESALLGCGPGWDWSGRNVGSDRGQAWVAVWSPQPSSRNILDQRGCGAANGAGTASVVVLSTTLLINANDRDGRVDDKFHLYTGGNSDNAAVGRNVRGDYVVSGNAG